MPTEFQEKPMWTDTVLQAITYWIGWNHTKYRHWDLTEGAIVAELQRLIASELDSDEALYAETYADTLINLNPFPEDVKRKEHYDLVIAKKHEGSRPDKNELHEFVTAVIEVKRNKSWNKIEEDIQKLARLAKYRKNTRFFIIVTSEGKPMDDHLVVPVKNGDFRGKKGNLPRIKNERKMAIYRVRRLCRASRLSIPSIKSNRAADTMPV